MKIKVTDLGAIKEGTIDLSKRLNVFCGPNGTGKTYMAYVIYSLTKFENKNISLTLEKSDIKHIIDHNWFEIKLNYAKLFRYREEDLSRVLFNLWNLFAIPYAKNMIFFEKTSIECTETQNEFESRLANIELKEEIKIYNFIFSIEKKVNSNVLKIVIPEKTIKNEFFLKFIEVGFLSRIYSILSFNPITTSVIFPVERNSIFTFSKELSVSRNDKLDKIQALSSNTEVDMFELLYGRTTRYPQPIRDGLLISDDLANYQTNISEYYEFAIEIEAELLKGKLLITKEGSVEFASNKATKTKLSFHQSSSIVKTLASLVLYLKHQAQHNDLVIIDEPELNLHPDNQIKLARIFSRLLNKGLRLIISTDSDYIVREFNNLIMISNDKIEVIKYAKENGYLSDEYIKSEDIGAYMFDYKNAKSKQIEVSQLKIDLSGFEIPSVNETIENQNKITEELYYNLKYANSDE